MEYTAFEYEVVQAAANRWRWAVKVRNAYKVGTAPDRHAALLRAEEYIDKLIAARSGPTPMS
jgi:hypothetical protein